MQETDREPLLEFDLPAVPEAPARARRRLRELGSALGDRLADVELALSEAVTNVVVHAYRDRRHEERGRVHVLLRRAPGELVVTVSDDGDGMVPRPDSPGIGAGLPIIASVSDRFEIQQRDRGTEVVMRFRLS